MNKCKCFYKIDVIFILVSSFYLTSYFVSNIDAAMLLWDILSRRIKEKIFHPNYEKLVENYVYSKSDFDICLLRMVFSENFSRPS